MDFSGLILHRGLVLSNIVLTLMIRLLGELGLLKCSPRVKRFIHVKSETLGIPVVPTIRPVNRKVSVSATHRYEKCESFWK